MALEESIAALTKAIEANTAALKAGGGGAKTASTGSAGYTPKYTREQMQAALQDVKAKFGKDAAVAVVKTMTGKDATKDVTDAAQIDKVYEAAKAKAEESPSDDV